MKPAHIIVGVVLALALAGGGFAAGMTVARASSNASKQRLARSADRP